MLKIKIYQKLDIEQIETRNETKHEQYSCQDRFIQNKKVSTIFFKILYIFMINK